MNSGKKLSYVCAHVAFWKHTDTYSLNGEQRVWQMVRVLVVS